MRNEEEGALKDRKLDASGLLNVRTLGVELKTRDPPENPEELERNPGDNVFELKTAGALGAVRTVLKEPEKPRVKCAPLVATRALVKFERAALAASI